MIRKIFNSICDFFDDVKNLFTNDEYVSLEKYNYSYSLPKDEFKSEVVNADFYIEEWFDHREQKVKFTVYKKNIFRITYDPTTGDYRNFNCGTFDTLDEAREVLKQLKKYKKPIIHYD